jgi:hypothetical protein
LHNSDWGTRETPTLDSWTARKGLWMRRVSKLYTDFGGSRCSYVRPLHSLHDWIVLGTGSLLCMFSRFFPSLI